MVTYVIGYYYSSTSKQRFSRVQVLVSTSTSSGVQEHNCLHLPTYSVIPQKAEHSQYADCATRLYITIMIMKPCPQFKGRLWKCFTRALVPWVDLLQEKYYNNHKLPSTVKKGSFWCRYVSLKCQISSRGSSMIFGQVTYPNTVTLYSFLLPQVHK